MASWLKTFLFLGISAILTHLLPTSLFRSVNTLIHEFAHAITTIVLSGQVMSIELYEDHSGVTFTDVNASWTVIPISLAGYILTSLFTVLLFVWYTKQKMRLGIQLITIIAIVALVLFVRNTYGVTWLLTFVLIHLVMLAFAPNWFLRLYYLLLAFICLVESVLSPLWLLIIAWQLPLEAGDASNLSLATGLPAWIWASGFLLIALACAKKCITLFAKENKQSV